MSTSGNSSLQENLALRGAFGRVEVSGHFSSTIPEETNYDDYEYPDCGYDDNGNN